MFQIEQQVPSPAAVIAADILIQIKYDPQMALQIGAYLSDYAEQKLLEQAANES